MEQERLKCRGSTAGTDQRGPCRWTTPGNVECKVVSLYVSDPNGSVVKYTIGRSKPLKQLMEEYCTRMNISLSHVRFRRDNGDSFLGKDTAVSLGLVDGDLLEVFSFQDGGHKAC